LVICKKDHPANMIYLMVKATFDKKGELAGGMAALAQIKPEMIKDNPIPLHPGALQYYKEKGISIPAAIMPTN